MREAAQVVDRGDVLRADYKAPWASGAISYMGRELRTRFKLLSQGMIESHCPCAVNQRDGRICVHVVAVGLMLHRRENNPEQRARREAERRRALAMFEAEQAGKFVARADVKTGGTPAEIRLRLPGNWVEQFWEGHITVQCMAVMAGSTVALDQIPPQTSLALRREDETLLFVLEDICEGRPAATIELTRSDLMSVFEVHRAQQRRIFRVGGDPLEIRPEAAEVGVYLDLDRENGELLLFANAILPGEEIPDPTALIVAHNRSGWVSSGKDLWPVTRLLPGPYQMVYHETVAIPRTDVVRFIRQELNKLAEAVPFESEIDLNLFDTLPARPEFSIRVRGTPASILPSLHAVYPGGYSLPANAAHAMGDFAIPSDEDLLGYEVRNLPAEQAAVKRLNRLGFSGDNGAGLEPVVGEREVLNFLGSQLPALRRSGWKVTMEGRVGELADRLETAIPVAEIVPGSESGAAAGGGYFDVTLNVQRQDGRVIDAGIVQRAILKDESYVVLDGETILLDTASIGDLQAVFHDCDSRAGDTAGSFRLSQVYAPYVLAALNGLDGVDIEQPPDWRTHVARQNRQERIEPVALGEPLEGILRPYQKEGVAWLRFLEANGVCGILADEMGLGKTLQTLAWLQLERCDPALEGQPALVVCPTSLVENWRREAGKFAPGLRVRTMSGARRHEHWDSLPEHDLVITSYALLRRDIERYRGQPFSCMILDEAQHIKNRSTQNALAAKQIHARHRLVLTGTPMENSVADLWSIMDFLMPGYLGDYETFRGNYELPIVNLPGEPEAEDAQRRLRHKLHPFLLRRRKRDVAKDLPPKIVKVSYCSMTPDQQQIYNQLLRASQEQVSGLVGGQGFNRSRIEILTILMRLRQVACHLGMLKNVPAAQASEAPSGKLEHFFELLDQTIDGGHRMLVFSQFVTMLTLLREELEARGIPYCYLDGSTPDRLEVCTRFNRDSSIPVFLISLKAGGTGLNLTGADTVVHFDPWWNPAVEDQATDRAHRIGQTRTVYSLKLITEGTVEEKVLELQRRKQALIGATVEGDEQTMSKLTWSDVRNLLDIGGPAGL